jgi:ATP-dependent exoDNAse (exonuclease V) beta subunit
MTMQLSDRRAREDALDIRHSYIVQAPAGSGKTALLTQRFLALLSTVRTPQEIIALTFTKKAASEMRTRIIDALHTALKPPPQEAYLLKTYELAKKALEQDKEQGWDILSHPSKLKIQTLDSLCHYLTSRMPLLSKSIPFSQINEDCSLDYEKAAYLCIETALAHPEYQEAANIFLTHLGNHRQRTIELLGHMLSKRDQWLSPIMHAKLLPREHFDETLSHFKKEALNKILGHFDEELLSMLDAILEYQAGFIDNSVRQLLNEENQDEFLFWQSVSQLILTSTGGWRKRFTKKEGFPPLSFFKNKEEKISAKQIKETLTLFLERIDNKDQLKKACQQTLMLPDSAFTDEQWQIIHAMLRLLPLLVAQLQLQFSEKKHVDFTEIALQANACLGDDTPTDLTLYLDNQIKHLLIDEFQDTSISQFSLIEKMTAGWEQGDGRTLFIVGDPMQSIYRFRQAEVGLFLKAKSYGIGEIKLNSLQLSTNFRSSQTLIDWVNLSCQQIFPTKNDMDTGAISYAPSVSINQDPSSRIQAFSAEDTSSEARHITQIIKSNPNKKIAILVSSRKQLTTLIPTLLAQGIQTQGVDLQPLSENVIINILIALTSFLLDPYDKLALANILVSPICGIDYPYLETLFAKLNDDSLIAELISLSSQTPDNDTSLRLHHVLNILNHHQEIRFRQPLQEWVKACFDDLNGDYLSQEQEENINAFWSILTRFTYPIDQAALNNKLQKLYSKNTQTHNVSVMTIHKSKGLEFDIVILPGLQYTGKANHTPILEWLEILDSDNQRQLLLSPIKSAFEKEAKLYQFIRHLDKEKIAFEKKRLLYVALTRAKTTLILFSSQQNDSPPKGSFLDLLSPYIDFEALPSAETALIKQDTFERLDHSLFTTPYIPAKRETGYTAQPKEIDSYLKQTGIFIHEQLYYIAALSIQSYQALSQNHWKARLFELGVKSKNIPKAIEISQIALSNLFDCPKGQWIISPRQIEANEYAITTHDKHYIIDRTFVDNQYRWIIDYKISTNSTHIDKKHIKQLETYATLIAHIDKTPIQLALYYPLEKRFIAWLPKHFPIDKILEKSGATL